MVGPASLRTKKALLTRYCNNLSRVIERINSAHTAAQASSDDATSPPRIKASLFELDATAKLAADALNAFTAALDEIDELPEEQDKQANDYIDSSLSLIERARLMAIELDAKNIGDREENDERGWTEMMRPKLPPIPIPIFTGKVQEYTNFWTLFESNVDRQPLTNLQKFNYLITALRGEPRELIKRYPITEANYTHAIQLLRDKYGDESKLIADLQSRLEMTKADNKSIYAQRRLLEQILPIVTQLEELGITLNGSYPTKKLLSKFSYTLQRQVLERCLLQNKKETDWIMRDVLSELDDLITTQEQISEMIDSIPNKCDDRSRDSHNNNRSKKFLMKNATTKPDPNACMFCGSTQHKSADCTRIPSIHQRRTYMQQHRRCLNCGKEGHFVKDCTSKGCRYCTGMKHHHTLCPQRHNLGETTDQTPPRARTNTNTPQNRPLVPNVPRSTKRHVKTAVATAQPVQTTDSSATYPDITDTAQHSPQDTSILQNSTVDALDNKVLLLTGVARVRDEARDDWKEVEILFDTGADQSFISSALAEELNLKCTKEKELTMYTFGSTDPKPTKCRHTTLDLWDNQGQKHPVRLCTTPVLTSKGQTTQLDHADLAFVAQHNIHLSKPTSNSTSIPQILLGCDQLWGLLDAPLPRFKLPSGLLLIPSKLGYLLTGKQHTFHGIEGQQNEVNISMITMVQAFTESEDEMSRWDRYWTMDSAGICEFTGTKNEEKTAVNEQVVMFFNNTIERRPDGYYVRLTYKDNHPPLPDNRQIALKRLQGVIRTLKSSPQLLQDYENTFHTQLEKGIIEQIPNDQPGIGPIVHYIPHQPVVTPHKETTKLRIVFDASSHYKECPSLNDILHQGPLVLPDLYAMLLRFRMLPYVAISDVEKAFLQIHLNEMDRDATRFIWVRDVDLPVTEDNIVTYRFTRVTFGLNVSPFLLAGTVTYHLHHVVENKELAKEIKDNLYVDNLILAARTPEDLAKKVVDSREIFQDMGMNLREFLANDVNLKDFISQEACAKAAVQKVLGIEWNATGDYLSMCCTLPFIGQVTKRIVARQIAAVYDPLGWLVPLLTQAKHFQQTLWKHKFEWDNILPASLQEQWQKITQNINGFARTFPRRFFTQPQDKDTCIAVFADASDIAMSTCAYLFDGKHSALVMAKCKLPSIKTTTTMPKMEMNALTMAARLTWSVYQAMKEPWPNMSASPPQIVILSDSQIALSWLTTSEEKASPGVLISNRIKEIRKITAALNDEGLTVRFAYVNTKDNPADAGTRGLNQEQLQDHPWWTGPDFLRTPINHWPTIFYPYDWQGTHETEELQPPTEAGTVSITMNSASTRLLQESCNDLIDAKRFSSFKKAKRVTAWALLFIKKLMRSLPQQSVDRIFQKIPELRTIQDTTILLGQHIKAARIALLRNHQSSFLSHYHKKLRNDTLRLYQDKDLLWRSQGRLQNSTLGADAKSPIFVAPNTPLSQLIIKDAHGDYHQGVEHTIATIRQTYWIPKIRQQVRKLVSKCVQCRRLNALPYPYPDMTDLPQQRVIRSHPFQHIGLDFFDLPSTHLEAGKTHGYGCIFTCMVTRLIHLEMVDSMSTEDFINALRRFVARRGVPDSITCDNAPSFLLGASILAGSPQGETLSSSIHNATSNQEIQWNHITPYAPWQGGFYERLIKSVKHALYKSLRGTNHRSGDHLRTILTEIEACLNSRPLTYQGDGQEDFSSIRPIDFLQKDLTLTLPTTHLTDHMTNDPDYHTPDEIRALQTRQEVIASLQSSCGATERFWTIWQKHYLTCLRETHRRTISSKRQGRETPTIGDVVLVSDPVLPRNEWKLARITDTRAGRDGEIREVELLTPARRKIRRPPNLLIPLEIQPATTPSHTTPGDHAVSDGTDEQIPTSHPYNLRPRRAVHYADEQVVTTTQTTTVRRSPPKWFLFYIMIITLFTTSSTFANRDISMTCSNDGVLVHTSRNDPFEICADHHCQMITPVTNPFLVKFPPEVTLHDYPVSLKWNTGDQRATMETMCHRLNFCQQLDCWICSAVVFNPECWPMGAIVITALLLYVIVAILYVLLYVPMTMGKPIRIILIVLRRILLILASALIKLCMTLCRRMRRRRPQSHRDRLLAVLAITLAVSTYAIHACQQVNVLEYRSTVCNNYDGHESCSIYLNELLKINTFHREACLRLTRNATLIANIKLRWKGLYLHCEQESRIFTRAVELQRIDSKRCPHMGSCQGQKCAAIHHSSLIPELEEGNKYPGRTGCMESCGGPGCDCFFLSSGCLFYRVYAVPKNSKVYEIFRCTRWTEQVKLEVTIEDLSSSEGKRRYVLAITPNVPTEVPSMTVTMTAVTLPPLPNLSKEFVTDGRDVAIWNNPFTPDLLCASWRHARDMNCTLKDDCRCHAAENSVSCACPTKDILAYFKQLNLVLPVKTASWELSRRLNETVTAKISQMVSADFDVQFKTVIETASLLVTNNVCNIANSELEGCYHCAKGATAKVTCRSSTNTLGEVLCGRHAFVVPCAPTSPESNLYFHLDSARQLLNCSIRCGETVHYFVLSGILRYTSNFHAAMTDFIQGNTTAYHGFQLQDFHHILNVFLDWYKVLFVSILAVIFALLVPYLCLQSLGIRLMTLLLRGALTLVCYPVRLLATTLERFRTPRPNRDAHEKWL
ncbi:hypothetical protein Y032_0206g1994 [Ancylostoma ceylanicum]|uniref:Integrase core domain protein n=2 Tax=Ancylostoma ceylanicum TaxID=53326 RepID=A0A016SLC8_9BILA|nr:hypothetical protein Y032_0206g1994 [Ancylostoma ceylanicum]